MVDEFASVASSNPSLHFAEIVFVVIHQTCHSLLHQRLFVTTSVGSNTSKLGFEVATKV